MIDTLIIVVRAHADSSLVLKGQPSLNKVNFTIILPYTEPCQGKPLKNNTVYGWMS